MGAELCCLLAVKLLESGAQPYEDLRWIGMKFQRGKSVVTWFGNRWRWNQAAKAR